MKLAFIVLTSKPFLSHTDLKDVDLILSASLVMFITLRQFEPMQLITERRESITNIENLLCCWLSNLTQISPLPEKPIEQVFLFDSLHL